MMHPMLLILCQPPGRFYCLSGQLAIIGLPPRGWQISRGNFYKVVINCQEGEAFWRARLYARHDRHKHTQHVGTCTQIHTHTNTTWVVVRWVLLVVLIQLHFCCSEILKLTSVMAGNYLSLMWSQVQVHLQITVAIPFEGIRSRFAPFLCVISKDRWRMFYIIWLFGWCHDHCCCQIRIITFISQMSV